MRIPFALALLALTPSLASAQAVDFAWTEIPAHTPGTNQVFGSDLSWDGTSLAIRNDSSIDVYAFDGVTASWEAQLHGDTSMGDTTAFPGEIFLSAGRVLGTQNGDVPSWSVLEFRRSASGTWSQVARLVDPGAGWGDASYVAAVPDGTRAVFTHPYDMGNIGQVTLVRGIGTGPISWTTANRSVLNGARSGDLFGHVVALHGADLLISALQALAGGVGNAGAAFLYHDDGTNLNLVTTLENPTPASGDQYGDDADFDAAGIYVGSHYDDTTAGDAGAVYVYTRAGVLAQTILGPNANGAFGGSLAISGDWLAIGAPTTGAHPGVGHLYLYQRGADGQFHPRADVPDMTSTTGGFWPGGVQLRGRTLVVSSSGASNGSTSRAGRTWFATFTEPDGNACDTSADCTHGHCVDGICCNTACSGACDTCGTGTCNVVMCDAGTDAGTDGGAMDDAATSMDAGVDAAMSIDVDAAPGPDANVPNDAYVAGDANVRTDATTTPDGGAVPRVPLSCTCRAAGEGAGGRAPLALGMLVLGWLARRSSTRGRRQRR